MSAGKIKWMLALASLLLASQVAGNDPPAAEGPTAAQSLQWLEEGNVRFQAGATEGPRRDDTRRSETFSKGQHPFAALLSCADSRVPPELLFDTGIGDLFVVRVAGNVADVDEIGTLEYGVEHLHIPLIVVVGHSKCGAVTAVVDGAQVPPNIAKLVDNIVPAVETTRSRFSSLKGPALVQQAIRMNVRQAMGDLLTKSEIVREAVSKGEVKVIGAVYDINSGSVEWMGSHPNETALLANHGEATASIDEHGGELIKNDPHSPAPASEPKPDANAHDAKPEGHGSSDPHAKTNPHPSPDPHAKPLEKDPHAPASTHETHGEAQQGDTEHGEHPTTQPSEKTSQKSQPHNFMALGGCLAGGAAMSVLTIHLMKPKKAAKQPVK